VVIDPDRVGASLDGFRVAVNSHEFEPGHRYVHHVAADQAAACTVASLVADLLGVKLRIGRRSPPDTRFEAGPGWLTIVAMPERQLVCHRRRGMRRESADDASIIAPAAAKTEGKLKSDSSNEQTTGGPS
jgi:hypothetical protein